MKYRKVAIALSSMRHVETARAFARQPTPHSAPAAPSPPHPSTLEQAVKQVQRQTHGHILAADTVPRGKANVYRIKVLTPQGQARVLQMHSNARTQSGPDKSDSDQGGH